MRGKTLSEYSYDLRNETWIPVVTRAGQREYIGLEQALLRAHHLLRLDCDNPLSTASVFRVLIALVHRIFEGPKGEREWLTFYEGEAFDEEAIRHYFRRWSDRFDLFHPDYPFFQCAQLENTDRHGNALEPFNARLIVHELTSGNNKVFFDHSVDATLPYFRPDEAARALVTAQYFSLGGLAKKTTNHFGFQQSYYQAPLVAGIPTLLSGESLYETIVLNLLTYQGDRPIPRPEPQNDIPIWERTSERRTERIKASGYLDYLTAPARHIRLIPSLAEHGVRVSSLYIAQGVAPDNSVEPWFFFRESPKTPGQCYAPQLDPDRAIWRDADAIFAGAYKESGRSEDRRPAQFRQLSVYLSDSRRRLACEIIALANSKATPTFWRQETMSFPSPLLENEDLMAAVDAGLGWAESVGGVLQNAARTFCAEVLGKNPNPSEVNEMLRSTGVTRAYFAQLEVPFRRWLSRIDEEKARGEWIESIREAARGAFEVSVEARAPHAANGYRALVEAYGILFSGLAKYLGRPKSAETDVGTEQGGTPES